MFTISRKAANAKENERLTSNEAEEEDEDSDEAVSQEQNAIAQQIIETGAVTPTKGKYVIHCLTIVGHIVIIDNIFVGYINSYKTAIYKKGRFYI